MNNYSARQHFLNNNDVMHNDEKVAVWVQSNHGIMPNNNPVIGGHDINGRKLYVGRASHANNIIPGTLVPSRGVCYVAYSGREYGYKYYQVLTNPDKSNLVWIPESKGEIPSGALQGGNLVDGQSLYIGRAWYLQSLVIGKINPKNGVLYLPFDGREISVTVYDVLCKEEYHIYKPLPSTYIQPKLTHHKSSSTISSRGLALLINNYEFIDPTKNFLPSSSNSSEKLSKSLSKSGYDVTSGVNLSATKMMEQVNTLWKNTKTTHDSVIIGISSHGNENVGKNQVVYGTDWQEVDFTDIILNFTSENCPQLRHKVKIFLIDSCRGNKDCQDISAEKILMQLKTRYAKSMSITGECPPLDENVIIINATQSGYYSYMGLKDPVLLFSCFADCLKITEYLSMGLFEFFEAIAKAVELEAKNQLNKIIKPEVKHNLDPNLKFSFGKFKNISCDEECRAIDKALLVIESLISTAPMKQPLFKKHSQENSFDSFPGNYMESSLRLFPKSSFEKGPYIPSSVKDIKPELIAFREGNQWVNISYDTNPTDAILRLRKLLSGSERVIFITHGFRSNIEIPWLYSMKEAMLQQKYQIVIIVGWGLGANLWPWEYLQAAVNIQSVAEWLAGYARIINDEYPKMEIWGVGHSLGAHLMGQAGRESKVFTRITGLDPAGPSFEHGDNEDKRLRKSDAKSIVDVIHTDGYNPGFSLYKHDDGNVIVDKNFVVNHYGTLIPLGTVDFYPNYGHSQPRTACKKGDNSSYSHSLAIELFTMSISNPGKFKTNLILDGVPDFMKPVNKYKRVTYFSEMGYYADTEFHEGNFYLETNGSEPMEIEANTKFIFEALNG